MSTSQKSNRSGFEKEYHDLARHYQKLQNKYLQETQSRKLHEQEFESAFYFSGIGMALVAPDGTWIRVNKAVCDIVGYTEEELLKLTFQDITHPDDLDADLEFVKAVLERKRNTYQMEKRYFHKNGHVVWIILTVSLVRDESGNPIHFIAQIQDISNRKKMEDELRSKVSETERLNLQLKKQVERLSEFGHITSHNLRGPISNLIMLAEFSKKGDSGFDWMETLNQFSDIGTELLDTIDILANTLSMGMGDVQQLKECSLSSTLKKIKSLFGPRLRELEGTIHCDFEFNSVRFVPTYLESIFTNLISNSLRYHKPGRSPEIEIKSGASNSNTSYISVSDNGLGIDLEINRKNIFRLNKTFHRHPDAKGIGLFLVKNQVEAMGGEISIESIPGEGTTFTITLDNSLVKYPE